MTGPLCLASPKSDAPSRRAIAVMNPRGLLITLNPNWIRMSAPVDGRRDETLEDLNRDPKPGARAAVGRALGLTGLDNRKGVGIVEVPIGDGRSIALPEIELVEIPAGKFTHGHAKPQEVTLPTFHMSRYPLILSSVRGGLPALFPQLTTALHAA